MAPHLGVGHGEGRPAAALLLIVEGHEQAGPVHEGLNVLGVARPHGRRQRDEGGAVPERVEAAAHVEEITLKHGQALGAVDGVRALDALRWRDARLLKEGAHGVLGQLDAHDLVTLIAQPPQVERLAAQRRIPCPGHPGCR